MLIFVN